MKIELEHELELNSTEIYIYIYTHTHSSYGRMIYEYDMDHIQKSQNCIYGFLFFIFNFSGIVFMEVGGINKQRSEQNSCSVFNTVGETSRRRRFVEKGPLKQMSHL